MKQAGRIRAGRLVLVLAAACGLAACGNGKLIQLRSETRSPDEFAILPTKPLDIPAGQANLTALPVPTPGGANRTDPTPLADATAVLGGNAGAVERQGTGGDAALLAQAGRYGADPAIRQDLAIADAEFRKDEGPLLLERMSRTTTYFKVYAPYALNQQAEISRWRARGVPTVTAPPPPAD